MSVTPATRSPIAASSNATKGSTARANTGVMSTGSFATNVTKIENATARRSVLYAPATAAAACNVAKTQIAPISTAINSAVAASTAETDWIALRACVALRPLCACRTGVGLGSTESSIHGSAGRCLRHSALTKAHPEADAIQIGGELPAPFVFI